ncbi:MAG: CRISPR-associated protein Cas4, partial [Planctomycetaceae bacterium]|nr:CRISPR-associated protein Cas4 [Planctomycetaceae bacterium]
MIDVSQHAAVVPQPGDSAAELPETIPVRMLNEFTYCPRLGFLEWVDGEWASNLETMEGTFGHRRVDREPKRSKSRSQRDDAKADSDDPPSESIHTRSLMLSAPSEGLVAKLDLLELEGMAATPVDYKRGKVPNVPDGAYEPERVQLCAQGLILRENGFRCERGVLYFIASKQRVTIEFTDELIARTRELRDQFRLVAAAGRLPPPLLDSPKCPRCSLVGICLPDEVNLLSQLQNHPGGPDGIGVDAQEIDGVALTETADADSATDADC